MGMIFGKIDVEQASHTILPHTFGPDATDVQLRKYDAHVLARVPASKVNENAQFRVLAKYIGVFGQPENTNTAADGDNGGNGGSKIAMTAPVLSSTSSSQSSPQKNCNDRTCAFFNVVFLTLRYGFCSSCTVQDVC